jgi:hypothetical protein
MPQNASNPEGVMEAASMLETIVLLSFCVLVGLASLAVVVWLAVTGALFSLDGLAFALVSLTLGGFMMFNVAWSLWKGELRALLAQRGKSMAVEKPEAKPAGSAPGQA